YISEFTERIDALEDQLSGGAGRRPERLARILALAEEEAEDLRQQARADAEEIRGAASREADETRAEATHQAEGIERSVIEIRATRGYLLEQLESLRNHLDQAIEYH